MCALLEGQHRGVVWRGSWTKPVIRYKNMDGFPDAMGDVVSWRDPVNSKIMQTERSVGGLKSCTGGEWFKGMLTRNP